MQRKIQLLVKILFESPCILIFQKSYLLKNTFDLFLVYKELFRLDKRGSHF